MTSPVRASSPTTFAACPDRSRSPSRPRRIALALACSAVAGPIVGVSSGPARASFFDTYGFSARAVARGGAFVALGFDYDAAYYNPANVLSRKRVHLGFGFDYVAPSMDFEAVQGEFQPLSPDANLGFHLGFSTPIGGIFDNVLGFGLAFFHPLTTGTDVSSVDPSLPWWYRYQSLPNKLIIAAGLAAEPVEWLRLGVGAQLLAGLDGEVDATISLAEGRFQHESIDLEVVPRLGPTFGLALGPFGNPELGHFRFGATFRGALELDYSLPVRVDIEQVGELDVLVRGVSLYTPDQLALGLGWESSPAPEAGLSAEIGLTWERWSGAPPAGARFILSVDDRYLQPTNPNDPSDTPDKLIDVQGEPTPLGAIDTVSARTGIEWRPDDHWALRAGYVYRPTPLPDPVYQTNTLDASAHVMSLGVGLQFGDPTGDKASPLSLDLALQWTHLNSRAVQKDPLAGSPQGAYQAGGEVWHISLDLRHDYF